MIFICGVFGGVVIALTAVAIFAIFWPKQLKSLLFPRDVRDFTRGTIYRKGQAPERIG